MKRILITGKGSYVGTSVKKYLEQWPKKYKVDEIEVKSDAWKNDDFSKKVTSFSPIPFHSSRSKAPISATFTASAILPDKLTEHKQMRAKVTNSCTFARLNI